MNPQDVIVKPSPFSVAETVDRLQHFLEHQGVTIYARIDQQKELEKAGLSLAPLEFLLFGNPKAGGPVMQENPLAAIALPLKVVAYEDKDKKVWVGYYSGDYVQNTFGVSAKSAMPLHIDGLIQKVLTQ